ncbi:MAG: aldehyde dehydrogenase family protein, partial [Bacteroidota bacterium]|nr:aldehyde dehydrogenase family protein [Bacteroidota bacterium]
MNTAFLHALALEETNPGAWCGSFGYNSDQLIHSSSPVDGLQIGSVGVCSTAQYKEIITKATDSFKLWRSLPAPKRGEIVRQFGEELRKHKAALGNLVSYEMGKSLQEGLGEVQEMIDICDFAVGLSRQLYGLSMHSERPNHRMYEQWHPLGIVGVISAFNFPVAVWAWNATLAWICGNVVVWKPSEKAPLCSIACQKIINKVLLENNLPDGISNVINGDFQLGQLMSKDP